MRKNGRFEDGKLDGQLFDGNGGEEGRCGRLSDAHTKNESKSIVREPNSHYDLNGIRGILEM